MARLTASLVAAGLVSWHGLRPVDVPMLLYGPLSTALLALSPGVRRSPVAWLADGVAGLALILLWGDWHSPYYFLWLTTLVLPATSLPTLEALWLAITASVAYLVIAVLGGPSPGRLQPVSSETLAIHVLLPLFLIASLAHAADVVRRFTKERGERERLAIEAERRRIAWELHDSAKQRLHAAHFLVSSLQGQISAPHDHTVERAVAEIESAASEMDTSLAELRSPLEGQRLDVELRRRAAEIASGTGATITIVGRAPALPPLVAAHVYRIGCEALTNALRHSDATKIDLELRGSHGGLRLQVHDDGRGLPSEFRQGASGMLAMKARAAAVGGTLSVGPGTDGDGTQVILELPPTDAGGVT